MRTRQYRWFVGALCALALAVPSARAQQQTPASGNQQNNAQTPIPAYHSPLGSTAANSQEEPQTATPDTTPLAGAQYISLAKIQTNRNYWQPHFDLSGSGDSNPAQGPSNAGWGTWASFLGGVDLHHISGRSHLTLDYNGGGMYSNQSNVSSGVVQEMGLTEKLSFRRSVLLFLDQLSYLPQASFGFGGLGQLPISGVGSTSLGPGFTPGQTILTGQGQSLTNSSVVQLNTNLTPRSSVTFAGGYALSHYAKSGLLDYGDMIFQGGYNYQMTAKNTIAVFYAFTGLRYSNFNQSVNLHSVEASYARRVTGKLAFQIAAGPQFAWFQTPISGGAGTGTVGSSATNVGWTLNAATNYQLERIGLGLNYYHGVTAGAGVLGGSQSDTVTGFVTRKMSRNFSSGITGGYARNNGLAIATGPSSGRTYDYWFAGATLAHPLTSTLALTLTYQMQYQNSNSTFCIGSSCGTNVVRHLFTVGLSWRQRPLVF